MARSSLTYALGELADILKSFLARKADLFRLTLLEKASLVGSYFLTSLFLVIVISFCLLFLSFAFVFWYADKFGELSIGFTIISGLYVVLGIVVYFLRRIIITRPIINTLSRIIFDDDSNEIVQKKIKIKKDDDN